MSLVNNEELAGMLYARIAGLGRFFIISDGCSSAPHDAMAQALVDPPQCDDGRRALGPA